MFVGQIILYRNRGRFFLGRYLSESHGMILVGRERGVNRKISSRQLIHEASVEVTEADFPLWNERCETISESLDLRDVWEIVTGQLSFVTLDQLAGLLWGSNVDEIHRMGLQLCLFTGSPYFVSGTDVWIPRSSPEIESYLLEEGRRLAVAVDRRSFTAWLSGTEHLSVWSLAQEKWLNDLKDYAVMGSSSQSKDIARNILRETGVITTEWQRLAFTLLVERGVFHEDEPLALHQYAIPVGFPPSVMTAGSENLLEQLLRSKDRCDLTTVPIITIDEPSTRDIDDGISVEIFDDRYHIGVHVTDVSSLVEKNGVLELEASNRVASLYFPETTIPMFPSSLSEGYASLVQGEPRLAYSVLIEMDLGGTILSWRVVPSVVRTHAQLSYADVDLSLLYKGHQYDQVLADMDTVANWLRHDRLRKGALEFNRPEMKIQVNDCGQVDIEVLPGRSSARRMVEEFMILANRLLAEYCQANDLPAFFRSLEAPDDTGLEDIPNQIVREYHLMRRIRPSRISLEPAPHSLLGVSVYLQGTSPIRRYLDLVMQRQIVTHLQTGKGSYSRREAEEILYRTELYLKDLAKIERNRRRYWVLKFFDRCTEGRFQGIVLEVRGAEAVVEMIKYPFRANVYLSTPLVPGEGISLRLEEIDFWKSVAKFVQLNEVNQ